MPPISILTVVFPSSFSPSFDLIAFKRSYNVIGVYSNLTCTSRVHEVWCHERWLQNILGLRWDWFGCWAWHLGCLITSLHSACRASDMSVYGAQDRPTPQLVFAEDLHHHSGFLKTTDVNGTCSKVNEAVLFQVRELDLQMFKKRAEVLLVGNDLNYRVLYFVSIRARVYLLLWNFLLEHIFQVCSGGELPKDTCKSRTSLQTWRQERLRKRLQSRHTSHDEPFCRTMSLFPVKTPKQSRWKCRDFEILLLRNVFPALELGFGLGARTKYFWLHSCGGLNLCQDHALLECRCAAERKRLKRLICLIWVGRGSSNLYIWSLLDRRVKQVSRHRSQTTSRTEATESNAESLTLQALGSSRNTESSHGVKQLQHAISKEQGKRIRQNIRCCL